MDFCDENKEEIFNKFLAKIGCYEMLVSEMKDYIEELKRVIISKDLELKNLNNYVDNLDLWLEEYEEIANKYSDIFQN